jgi:hypothetical protein
MTGWRRADCCGQIMRDLLRQTTPVIRKVSTRAFHARSSEPKDLTRVNATSDRKDVRRHLYRSTYVPHQWRFRRAKNHAEHRATGLVGRRAGTRRTNLLPLHFCPGSPCKS